MCEIAVGPSASFPLFTCQESVRSTSWVVRCGSFKISSICSRRTCPTDRSGCYTAVPNARTGRWASGQRRWSRRVNLKKRKAIWNKTNLSVHFTFTVKKKWNNSILPYRFFFFLSGGVNKRNTLKISINSLLVSYSIASSYNQLFNWFVCNLHIVGLFSTTAPRWLYIDRLTQVKISAWSMSYYRSQPTTCWFGLALTWLMRVLKALEPWGMIYVVRRFIFFLLI